MILFDREFLSNTSNIHVVVPRGGLSLRKVDRDVYIYLQPGKVATKTYSIVSLLKDCFGNCRIYFMPARPYAYTKIAASHSRRYPYHVHLSAENFPKRLVLSKPIISYSH